MVIAFLLLGLSSVNKKTIGCTFFYLHGANKILISLMANIPITACNILNKSFSIFSDKEKIAKCIASGLHDVTPMQFKIRMRIIKNIFLSTGKRQSSFIREPSMSAKIPYVFLELLKL